MAQDSWPSPNHNSRNVTDPEYERLAARFSDDGIWGAPSDSSVVFAGTGLEVKVRAGKYGSLRGHAWTSGGSDVSLAISANNSGQTRNDRVVLRLDRSTWDVRAVVLEGTPGAGSPALTQDPGETGVYEILLAGVVVPDAASSVSVIRAELYVGSRVRPVLSSHPNLAPLPGEIQYETDTGRLRFWDGSTRRVLYEDSGLVVVNSTAAPWNITFDTVLQRRSGNVHLRLGNFQRTGSNLAGGADSKLPVAIPSAYRHPTREQHGIIYVTGSGAGAGRVTVYAANQSRAGQVWLTQHTGVLTNSFVTGSTISWVVD